MVFKLWFGLARMVGRSNGRMEIPLWMGDLTRYHSWVSNTAALKVTEQGASHFLYFI